MKKIFLGSCLFFCMHAYAAVEPTVANGCGAVVLIEQPIGRCQKVKSLVWGTPCYADLTCARECASKGIKNFGGTSPNCINPSLDCSRVGASESCVLNAQQPLGAGVSVVFRLPMEPPG